MQSYRRQVYSDRALFASCDYYQERRALQVAEMKKNWSVIGLGVDAPMISITLYLASSIVIRKRDVRCRKNPRKICHRSSQIGKVIRVRARQWEELRRKSVHFYIRRCTSLFFVIKIGAKGKASSGSITYVRGLSSAEPSKPSFASSRLVKRRFVRQTSPIP